MQNTTSHQRSGPNERFGKAFFGRENDFQVAYVPSTAGTYKIFIDSVIEDAQQFQDAVLALESAQEEDTVVIHLSTCGGTLDATDTFIHAMRRCSARVIVSATGGCHSAGTIILMNAPEFTLSENFNALVHNGSMGGYAKTSDIVAQMKFSAAYMERVARQAYTGFLTEEELVAMIGGKDFWMEREEWCERWKGRQAYLKAVAIAEGRWDEETNSPIEELDEEEVL